MLMPKRVKHRKVQRGKRRGKAWRGSALAFGDFGLKAMDVGWVTDRQIEAARVAINRHMKRGGKLWIRIFPDRPITKTAAETRMGKGKGAVDHWAALVKRGKMMFELAGVPDEEAKEALRLASNKLPVQTKVVGRADFFI